MMDIVANHTSTEHEWFVQALAGDPRYQGYYVFRDQAFVDAHPITSILAAAAGSMYRRLIATTCTTSMRVRPIWTGTTRRCAPKWHR